MLKSLRLQPSWQLGNKRVYLVAGLLASVCQTSFATVSLDTTSLTPNRRSLTMRVGSATFGSAPNTVKFDVNNANISPIPIPVLGIPDAGSTNAAGVANSVRISVSNNSSQNHSNNIRVTVNSSAGMGFCTSSTSCNNPPFIPFSSISWVSSNLQTGTYSGQDFASGSFTGSSSQPLIDFTPPTYLQGNQNRPYSASITNDQVFTYNNTTLYPAGQYKGTVTYTATLP